MLFKEIPRGEDDPGSACDKAATTCPGNWDSMKEARPLQNVEDILYRICIYKRCIHAYTRCIRIYPMKPE